MARFAALAFAVLVVTAACDGLAGLGSSSPSPSGMMEHSPSPSGMMEHSPSPSGAMMEHSPTPTP
jgi:hypothetical protein